MHLLCVEIRWMMFTKMLMITAQVEIKKVLIFFDDMIAGIMSNKKFQVIIKELFISCRKLKFNLFLLLNLIFLFQKM